MSDIDTTQSPSSVFYGYFSKYTWRNEKNGNSFFRIVTKQELFFEQQYCKKEVKKNPITEQEETLYTISCDGSKYPVPAYDEKTPIRIRGFFRNLHDKGFGWDFQITDIRESTSDEVTTIEYLNSEAFPGVTYQNAVDIVRLFGTDIFAFIKRATAKQELIEKVGLSPETADRIVATVRKTSAERELFAELSEIGISYGACAKAIKWFGNNAISCLRKDPYAYGKKIGLSYKQEELLCKHFSHSANTSCRLRACSEKASDNVSTSGHIWTDMRVYYQEVKQLLNNHIFDEDIALSTCMPFIQKQMLLDTQNERFYDRSLLIAEQRAARNLLRLALAGNREMEPFRGELVEEAQKVCGIRYGRQQRKAFNKLLLTRGVKILTGGPGTGKTSTINGMLHAYEIMHPDHIIRLCAPTGRAAQRMSESTGRTAVTIHRLLDYQPDGLGANYRNEKNPVDADLVVVDEMSMADIRLFDMLLAALKTGTKLILVGDVNQLESVGAGSVLNDLMGTSDLFIEKNRLTEVFRQKGGSPIIDNSQKINEGNIHLHECEDFQIIHTKCEEETLEQTKILMQKLYNKDNPFETQILCPSRKGEAGIENCNTVLQDLLNPGKQSLTYGNTKFRVNDKIIMMKNNYSSKDGYFNGDIGIVKELGKGKMVADIRGEMVNLCRDALDDVQLAYGMTIHKSQGSEFKNAIVVMPSEPANMLVRNLLYTGVTRAKKRVFIINEGSAMECAIRTNTIGKRRTMFAEYLALAARKYEESSH